MTPTAPTLPATAVVGLWFGFNGTFLHLSGDTTGGRCVNGSSGTNFGQFAYCNAPAFFQAANAAIGTHKLRIPALGTGKDGEPCPTTRSFAIVDMDQSDNVQTQYLANGNGQTAQFSIANQNQLQNGQQLTNMKAGQMKPSAQQTVSTLGNPSDNALVSRFVDPALGCQPWMIPDLVNNGVTTATLATDELQAAAFQLAPSALVPAGDEMVLVDNQPNVMKTNAYRIGVDQPLAATLNDANTAPYCKNILHVALARLVVDKSIFLNAPSPDMGAANSLFTFLANRLNTTLGSDGLNCTGLLNIQNPVTLVTDGNGVVTDATISTTTTGTVTGTPAVTGTGTGATSVQVPLVFNNIGISNDGAPNPASFDGAGYSYSAQALRNVGLTPGATVSFNGVNFLWPKSAVGTPDNVQANGQVIPVPQAQGAKTLAFLGSAGFGPSSGTATITYTDGSTQSFTLAFSDWTLAGGNETPLNGNQVVATTAYRNFSNGSMQMQGQLSTVLYTDVALQAGKTIKHVQLPAQVNQGNMHIFAISTTGTGTTAGTTSNGNGNASQNSLPFNNKGISSDNNQAQANFDGVGNSYSAQALQNAGITPGNTVTFNGVTFTWPSATPGTPDNVQANGQVIPVTAANGATTLAFLGASSFGPSVGTATITYTDGTTQTFSLVFSDWILNFEALKPAQGNQIVAALPYSNTPNALSSRRKPAVFYKPDVFYTDVLLEPGKTIKSVTLPTHTTQGQIHIFAMSTK